ncbi:MAG TPA: TIGR03986 family CRISPR-associated RAMP protein [Cyanobacteria bacterium UBA8803]|nr:TIGR03986 family CRISPR-associated RAMP protein [Cyanobacteria bacterium UBA9273]HBL58317.1 TIGR03986 family CRISPR-associated RAMP protein [Cyanobacteria bacterium UBA8803]
MNPRHLKNVPDNRKAIAPYNFVELPNKVVPAQVECNGKLRDNDRYYSDRHTGKIVCTLKTESPLYIRCGLTPVDFANFGDTPNEDLTPEQRKKKAEFFLHPSNLHPILPGSSLRGMLRTLVEILSFSKIERVSDQQKFFFRAVAADKDDPLSKPYKNSLKNVKAGYLEFDKKQNKWFLRPAQEIEGQLFREVKEEDINDSLSSLILMKKASYIPQYIQISFEVTTSINVSEDLTWYSQKGWLLTSGNMLENMLEKTKEREREALLKKKEGRKYHYIVGEADRSARRLEISPDAIRDYRDALTNFQKGKEKPFKDNPKNRFDEKMGVVQEGLPIFYCEPQNEHQIVTLFGQSPNFRIPCSPNNDGKAASAVNFIPKEVGEPNLIDLADAIFGFVRGKKDKTEGDTTENSKEKREQSRAGRIFVSDAPYKADEDGIWLTDDTITSQILASPKPTTFQHYLVQPENTQAVKSELKHYGKPITETVIRGHKLYWHKGNISKERIQADATEAEIEEKRSQYTEIKPIKADVSFKFTIHFENLSDVELGVLLWILTLAGDDTEKLKMINLDGKEKYRLSLGMGKPLGMGAVAIDKYDLILNERCKNEPKQRYTQLFDGEDWVTSDRPSAADEYKSYVEAFECYVIDRVDDVDLPEGCTDRKGLRLKDIPRIQMLLAILSWSSPPVDETRYMEIERDINKRYRGKQVKQNEQTKDEYVDRLVLPTPLQIKEWEDRRRMDNSPASPSRGASNNNSEGSKPQPFARPPKPK